MARRPMGVLAVNCGSSSLKFALYRTGDGEQRMLSGSLEGIGAAAGAARVRSAAGEERVEPLRLDTHQGALEWLIRELERTRVLGSVNAVGHRLVHGGERFRAPVVVTPPVLASLDSVVPLAPLHLPRELGAVRALGRLLPDVPQVACFDTAFHAGLPLEARWFGLPRHLAEQGVHRYGFHGLSCEYVVEALTGDGVLGERTIVAHLGHGASLTAVRAGASVDTSMGLTPSGGIMMSTRSGDLDPGALLYHMRTAGLTADGAARLVSSESGLLGISGTTDDMRELLRRRSSDAHADEAVRLFCYQASKCVGAFAAALGGLDALVFTGGIGEHAAPVRAAICERLEHLGIRIDAARNDAHAPVVSPADGPVAVRVVRTNEELMIVRHTARTVS